VLGAASRAVPEPDAGARVTCVMQVFYGDACRRQVNCTVMKRGKKTRLVRRSHCAVACTLDIIGDRWTLLVVRDLLRGKRYFDDFLRSPEGIATNVLSARLRALCAQGWVEKTPDPSDQRRYTYRLSDDGLRLGELLGALAAWGLKYLPGTMIMGRTKPAQG
jgi:DNA-binding HxlR family transcriptional regulator